MYLPTDRLTFSTPNEVEGPALFWDIRHGNELMLVTREADPMVVFLTGESAGNSYRAEQMRSFGYWIGGIGIEVDQSSAFQPAYVDEPIGAVILGPEGYWISTYYKAQQDVRDFPIFKDIKPTPNQTQVGYKKWRVYIEIGQEHRVLFEMEATRTGAR